MAEMIQNNFVAGEISPALYGRSDLASYYRACASSRNFVVSREGTLKKRHGIGVAATVNHPFSESRVIPYIYDRDEAGVIVFWKSGASVMAEIRSKDALGEPGTAVTVYTGANVTADVVKSIRCSQIGDTVYANAIGVFNKMIVVTWATKTLTASDYRQCEKPERVTAISVATSGWPSPGESPSYRRIYYSGYVVRDGVISDARTASVRVLSVWSAGATITVAVAHGQSLATKDFDYILIGKKSGSFYGELARFYPDDVTEDTVEFTDENHVPSDVIYSQTNVLGNDFRPPLTTGAFQQRLVFANASSDGRTLPMTLWFSSIGNLYNFYADRPAADDDPFSPTLMSTGPAFIRWLVPYQRTMVVFTDAGIFSVVGSQNEGFSASTCTINKLSNISVSQVVQPVESEAGIAFVGSDDKTLYTLAYDLQADATRPVNRMMLVKHITRSARITSIALRQYPDQVIWCALSDGTLASFTFDRREDENITAWSRHASDNMTFLEVVGTGSVTDGANDHTYSDVVFVIGNGSASFKLGAFRTDWQDVNVTNAPVAAELVTLPMESQQETIAFRRKTAKDVLVRLFESGPVKVAPWQSGLTAMTLNGGQNAFTGEKKVKPTGYVSEHGQMRFFSDTNANAEILSVVVKTEVD